MKRDRMQLLLEKRSPRASTLALLHDQGLADKTVVQLWEVAELDAARDNGLEPVDLVWESAQQHADDTGDVCRFRLQWQSEAGNALVGVIHSATPTEKQRNTLAKEESTHAQIARELLVAIKDKDKVIQGSIGVLLKAYESALAMQDRTIVAQARTIEVLAANHGTGGAAPENPEVVALKIRGLERLISFLPDAARLGIAAYTEHRDEKRIRDAQAAVAASSNGSAPPATPPEGTQIQ